MSPQTFAPRNIFEPFRLKNLELKNRVLRSSVGGRMAGYNGVVTSTWKNFEKRFAAGGVGAIISTTFDVNKHRQSPFEYPSLADNSNIGPLRHYLNEIRDTGCKYIIQIGDPGYATQTSLFPEREDGFSSSAGFDLLYGYTNCRVQMRHQNILQTIQEFTDAAGRVRDAGADGLEVTAEKGYMIHQFLNPGMNRRTDDWGGDPDRRFRLLEEIVKSIRKRVGTDFLFGIRFSAVDFNHLPTQNFIFRLPWVFPWRHHWMGNGLDQTLEYGKRLRELGVDYLHITSGFGFINPRGNPGSFPVEEIKLFCNATRRLGAKACARSVMLNCIPTPIARWLFNIGWPGEGPKNREAINLGFAEQFKRQVGLPVIANGGFRNGAVIDGALDGRCDLVSMARALIATPCLVDDYFRKGLTEPEPAPRSHFAPVAKEYACTYCNRCCARTATSPLGCYETRRFVNLKSMIEQIMDCNRP